MKTQIEVDVSEALAQRAASLPRAASERLRALDYHPRRQLLGVPVAVGAGVAASAATVGTVLTVVLGGASPAYAGWSAMPTSSAPPPSAVSDCQSQLSSLGSGASNTATSWQVVLTDVRGPFTIVLLQDGTADASCFTGPSFTEVNRITPPASGSGGAQSGALSVNSQVNTRAANAGGSGTQPGGVGSQVILEGTTSGDLNVVLQNHLTTSSEGPYTFIDGRVNSGVAGVTLALNDGQHIVATVADGWFVAWWPGDTADATGAQVTKASGTTSESFVPLSHAGLKAPFGQGGAAPGSCTSTNDTSGGTSLNCTGGSGSPASGKTGTSGAGTNTGGTGSTGTKP